MKLPSKLLATAMAVTLSLVTFSSSAPPATAAGAESSVTQALLGETMTGFSEGLTVAATEWGISMLGLGAE